MNPPMQKTSKTEALAALDILAEEADFTVDEETGIDCVDTLRSFINASPDTGEAVAWRLNTVSGGHAFTEDAAYAAKCGAEPLFTHPVTPSPDFFAKSAKKSEQPQPDLSASGGAQGLEWGQVQPRHLYFNDRLIGYVEPSPNGWDSLILGNTLDFHHTEDEAKVALAAAARTWLSPLSQADTVAVSREDAEYLEGLERDLISKILKAYHTTRMADCSAEGHILSKYYVKEAFDRLRASMEGK
jgi:hypothetical protein